MKKQEFTVAVNFNLQELETVRQALQAKAEKLENQIEVSYKKTGPSARLDRKGVEVEVTIEAMKKINEQLNAWWAGILTV